MIAAILCWRQNKCIFLDRLSFENPVFQDYLARDVTWHLFAALVSDDTDTAEAALCDWFPSAVKRADIVLKQTPCGFKSCKSAITACTQCIYC